MKIGAQQPKIPNLITTSMAITLNNNSVLSVMSIELPKNV